MFESIRNFLSDLRDSVGWLPDWAIGAAILLLAAVVALSLHRTLLRLARRLLRDRHPYVRTFLTATMSLTRLALLVLALFIALPLAPFDSSVEIVIAKMLLLATILLIGWAAITAVDMAADLYLLRFRLDVADNLLARKHLTQVRVLTRTVDTVLIIATIGAALMTFDAVRHYGVSLFASAGIAGLIAGLAARPLLGNLFAGIQIAVTQPIRIDDSVLVEGEFGRVEEITSTYVVIRLWDLRRLIVPLTYFIEKPFQNWTRDSTSLMGAVSLHVDYTAPVARIREQAIELVKASPLWDGQVANVQVVEARESSIELRVVVSARTSGDAFDLRCEVREKLIDFIQREFPTALPHARAESLSPTRPAAPQDQPASLPTP